MVKDRPRNHLGSELYAPQVSPVDIPSATLSPTNIQTNAGTARIYRSIYKPSREFSESNWNCTFTVRVPRYYLMPTEREKICAGANLWGTSIYTDDSDPVAMAIHSGWIRGEWGDGVDASLLDIAPPPTDLEVPEEMDAPPPAPIIPPEDCEAHITMVILPTLQRYQGAVMNGIKSRPFGPPPTGSKDEKKEVEHDLERSLAVHDGSSWMISSIRWVDERLDRGYGRTAAEKRRHRADIRESVAADALLSLLAGAGARPTRTAMEGVEMTGPIAATPVVAA
jgi:Histone deacetylation protein Rxt3